MRATPCYESIWTGTMGLMTRLDGAMVAGVARRPAVAQQASWAI
jgi:hypothetical protein